MKGEDRLSNLPKEIRNHIVSFLPMKDVVRISTLSKEWRNICSSLSNFNFDYGDIPYSKGKVKQFVDFVERILRHHDKSDIQKLRLFLEYQPVDNTRSNSWISFAVRHNVRELDLDIRMRFYSWLPSSFFTCKSLTVLKLRLKTTNLYLPTYIQLPKLKTLMLANVVFLDDNLTAKLFSSCPELEQLTIDRCRLNNLKILHISPHKLRELSLVHCLSPVNCKIKVSSPTLQRIEIIGNIGENFEFENLSSLQFGRVYRSSFKVLKSLYNVISLELCEWCIQNLSMVQKLSKCLPTFENLKTLNLTMWNTESINLMITSLVSTFPNLEDLSVVVKTCEASPSILNQEWESSTLFVEGMFDHLKKVGIKNFQGSENELKLVEILLENAKALNEMRISYGEGITKKWRMKIIEKLNTFTRYSPTAKVFLP